MSAIQSLSGDKQTSSEHAKNDAHDPERKSCRLLVDELTNVATVAGRHMVEFLGPKA